MNPRNPALTLVELAGSDAELRMSPHCWKTRMALAHKGLEAKRIPWRFSERASNGGQYATVPVLLSDDRVIADSWNIAMQLELDYPDRPTLFGGDEARALAAFVNTWVDASLIPLIAAIVIPDVHAFLAPEDQDYFRATRETRFGATLEQLRSEIPQRVEELGRVLEPLRRRLAVMPYVCGPVPLYADYCVFGAFMFARASSPQPIVSPGPILDWRNRLLDALGGIARSAPSFGS